MFTGIVETLGTIVKIAQNGSNKTFWIKADFAKECKPEQSILHDGVCLTIEKVEGNTYQVTAIEETLKKTNLKNKNIGDEINLERSLTFDKFMDGHLVQGHVDSVGFCHKIEKLEGSWLFHFRLQKQTSLVVPRGSIAINGVSLTLAEVSKKSITVAIIPYTYEHTNFNSLKEKEAVNIEFDIIGKYVLRQLSLTAKQ